LGSGKNGIGLHGWFGINWGSRSINMRMSRNSGMEIKTRHAGQLKTQKTHKTIDPPHMGRDGRENRLIFVSPAGTA
jgi:hypothetical protein